MLQKVKMFVWRLVLNALPTLMNLRMRHINTDGMCPICNIEEESTNHLFLRCGWVKLIWFVANLLQLEWQDQEAPRLDKWL